MINLLFDRVSSQFRNPGSQPNGPQVAEDVYLLAWVSQPAVAVRVNGQAATQNGLTLYIIHLATGSGR